jgi:hypothetical protein
MAASCAIASDERVSTLSNSTPESFKKAEELAFSVDDQAKRRSYTQREVALIRDYEDKYRDDGLRERCLVGMTVGQMTDGLDALFEDFKNRAIKLTKAVYVVKKQIKGAPDEEVEAVLSWLRSGDRARLWLKDKDGRLKAVTFP